MIDTHCHIDDPQYAENLDTFIRTQQQEGVEAILVPGVDVTSIVPVREVCARYPGFLYPAIGLHPENIDENWQQQLATLHSQFSFLHSPSSTNYIAIGEIGLDYHFSTQYKSEQQEAFRTQLDWAVERDLPVMIHSRDATEDTLSILREYTCRGLRGVMHCFSGSRETAEIILKMGLKLGIGGILTFKNCHLSETLQSIPLEALVLETDAPYMAPVPHRGERNESRWMRFVMERLATIYGVSVEEIDRQTTITAKMLFRL